MKTAPIAWLGKVLAEACFTAAQKVVAGTIAVAVSEDDRQIGYRQIARACGVSPETAMRAALRLEAEGWLGITRIEGEANVFALSMPQRPCGVTKTVRR